MFYLTIVNKILRNCHSWLTRQYIKDQNRIVTTEKYLAGKANLDIWRNCTEERYKVWNESILTMLTFSILDGCDSLLSYSRFFSTYMRL